MQTGCALVINNLRTRYSYKIIFVFHKSALHLARYEVGKQVTELFPYKERFAL